MRRLTPWLSAALLAALPLLFACAGAPTRNDAQGEFNRGLSLFNRGHFAEAVPAFERATELKPDWGEAYLYLGRSLLSEGKWSEALPPLRAAYRLSPEKARREAGEIILDVLLSHAADIDPLLRSEFEELVAPP